MWRILSSLWNRTPSRPPPAPHAAEDAPVSEPSRTPEDAPVAEPFPVFDGSPEGYHQLGIVGPYLESHTVRALDPDGREVYLRHFLFPAGADPAAGPAGLVEPFRSLWHPFLLRPLACYVSGHQVTLVTESAGDDLGAWFDRCRRTGQAGIPVAPLLGCLGEAAEALDYLRACGICHRRLQPSHLVLREGHARVDGYITFPETMVRAHLPPMQELQMMSPEEWTNTARGGNPHPYKLGVLYHYLRTGRFPFAGSVAVEAAMQMGRGTPDLSALPEAERPVVGRALAREPRERHGSCVELVRELKGAVAPGCVRPPRARRRADPAWLDWNGGTARALARAIGDDSAFDRLPVLADALEDAGCTDPDLLGHLRGPGPHVRGCWVLDVILGKK